jgi:hypothetical protein
LFAVLVGASTAFSRPSACCSDSIELIATDVTDALAVEVVGDNTEVVVETIGANGSRGLNTVVVVVVARIVVVVVRFTTVVVVAVRLTTVVVVVLRGTVVTLRTVVAVVGATVVVVVAVGATVVVVVAVGATVVDVVVVVVVPGSGDPPDDGAGTLFVTEVAANVAASLPAASCNAFVSLLPVGSV